MKSGDSRTVGHDSSPHARASLIRALITEGEDVVRQACEEINKNSSVKSTGGYLCATTYSGQVLLVVPLGVMDELDKIEGRFARSQEKAKRLAANPTHVSAWESRDPDGGKYGGAIRIRDYNIILSFAGLPEHYDEACLIEIASRIFPEESIPRSAIRSISSNPHILDPEPVSADEN